MTKETKSARFGRKLARVLVAVILCVAAFPAMARSAFDFDADYIPISYVTRGSTDKNALTNSSARTWLGASGRIEMSVTLMDTKSQQIFAQGVSASASIWELIALNNGQWRLGYGTNTAGNTAYYFSSSPTIEANTKYDIVCERKNGKLYLTINGVECVKDVAVDELAKNEGLTFFHRKHNGNWGNNASTMKFHGAKIYNGGVLEAEYVPCVYKVFGGCIYDKVGDVVDYSPVVGFDWNERADEIHEKFCNLGKADGGEEVDWVLSPSAEQYLQTDFLPDSTDVIKMKVALMCTNVPHCLFSAGGAGPSDSNCNMMELMCMPTGKWRPSFQFVSGSGDGSWTTNVDYEVEYSAAGGFKVNGLKVMDLAGAAPSTTFTPTYGLTFFSRLQVQFFAYAPNPLSSAAQCKFYWAKVYASDGTTLKADFVPYVDGDGFVGIKDKVSGKVFLPLFGRLTASNGARPQAVYVSPDSYGDDSNAGTFRSPYKTIDSAVTNTVTAGTLYLKDGTYSLSTQCNLYVADRAHSVVGVSGDPAKVIIRGTRNDKRAFMARTDLGAINPVIKNLTFSNFKMTTDGATIYAVGALIENCVFEGNETAVTDTSKKGGILCVDNSIVRRCVFRNNLASGTKALGSGAVLLGDSKMENCLFEGNVADGPEGRCCTVFVADDSTAAIRNCTFTKNSARATTDESTAGIRFDSASARVVNTVFYGNEHSLGGSLAHSVGRFMHGTYDTAFVKCAADYRINAGCRIIDGTVFADWANGDYTPHEESRLINRGSAYLGAGATPEQYGADLLGNPRYVGAGIDIGAYEWQGKDPVTGFAIVFR